MSTQDEEPDWSIDMNFEILEVMRHDLDPSPTIIAGTIEGRRIIVPMENSVTVTTFGDHSTGTLYNQSSKYVGLSVQVTPVNLILYFR